MHRNATKRNEKVELRPGDIYSTHTTNRAGLTLRKITDVDPVRGLIRTQPFPVPRALSDRYVDVPGGRSGTIRYESVQHSVREVWESETDLLASARPEPEPAATGPDRMEAFAAALAARIAEALLPEVRRMVAEGVQDGYGRL